MKQYITKESLKKGDYANEHNPNIGNDLIDLLSNWLSEFLLTKSHLLIKEKDNLNDN
ncbi:hypothetical protein GMA92_09605 [Turicibacter sanguinis]|uniref:Uncharacterized protein n=1 Tax=Turicibacter sanguinis TaxID=154288 RepID=A0A9X5APS1_9FIRM|nr:hypothetical protein [Turicibacter sanguinis]MTK21674.1 hypothetical protein [Turicibacter sanguinis]MTK73154.1 hypothetical protein [Turicibacter sanguinis]